MKIFSEKKIYLYFIFFIIGFSVYSETTDKNVNLELFQEKTKYSDALSNEDVEKQLVVINDDDLFFSDDMIISDNNSSDDSFFSEDDMFSDSMIDEGNVIESEEPLTFDISNIYAENKFRFGCSFSATLDGTFLWYDPLKDENRNTTYRKNGFRDFSLVPKIKSDFYFDFRPVNNLRFYAKAKFKIPQPVFYPFTDKIDNVFPDEKNVISWFEYFLDYNLKERIFFRLGKHTITWGVGYFFSPADVINLSAVDPENPTEQREGAISLRTQIVFPGTQNCLWLYVLPDIKTGENKNDKDESFNIKKDVKYTAFAAKYELLVKNFEVGLGGWYQYGRTPRAVATLTGGIRKVATFSELVFAYGTEEQWFPLTKNGKGTPKYEDMKTIFQATTGFSYTWKEPKITLMGQYFFNGFGSKDTKTLSEIDFLKLKNSYTYAGKHFAVISLSKTDVFVRDCNINLYTMLSLTDGSGVVQGTISYSFLNDFKLSTGPIITFGTNGSEFTRVNGYKGSPSLIWKLSLTYDAGKF